MHRKFGGRRKETSNREEKTLGTIFIIYTMSYMTIHLSKKYSTQNSTYQASCYSLQNKYKISGGSAALFHLGRILSSVWTRPLTLVSYMWQPQCLNIWESSDRQRTHIRCSSDQLWFTGTRTQRHTTHFFHFIRQEIEGAPREPVIGSDEEMAIRKAAKSVFPTSSLIACSRHLKTNMKVYLRDKLGAAATTRHNIVTAVFGPGGITSSPTTAIFEARLTNIQTTDLPL